MMAPSKTIHTPILRLYVGYYRCLGLHLFDWGHHRGLSKVINLANLAWNITLNLIVVYRMHYLDPFQLGNIVGMCDSFKPLFAYFIRLGSNYAYPGIFILNMLYMVTGGRGPAIVRLLDSPCFRRGARSEPQAAIVFIISIAIGHLLFAAFLLEKVASQISTGWPSGRQMCVYTSIYVIFHYNYALFFAVHYYQHGVRSELTRISSHLRQPLCTLAEEVIALGEIERMALIGRQFSALFSLPVVTFGVLHAFNCILMGSLLINCTPCYGMMQHAGCVVLYSLFILRENAVILGLLDGISTCLRRRYCQLLLSGKGQIMLIKNENNHNFQALESTLQSHAIRIAELDACFRSHFRLNIFRLAAVDFALYLSCVLFVFNYILIFTQTNL